MIITLDGPAGVGKSTLAKKLATHFCIPCLDTGAMYRSIGLQLGATVADMDEHVLEEKLTQFSFALRPVLAKDQNTASQKTEPQNTSEHNTIKTSPLMAISYVLHLNGNVIGEEIRTEKVGRLGAIVASLPAVRHALQHYQRAIGEHNSLVTEGRDMGTSVFPYADVKFFLDARPEVRAQRRYLELTTKNIKNVITYEEILKDINTRDDQDRNRKVDPLKPAPDAIIVDTSDCNQDEVFAKLVEFVENKIQLSSSQIREKEKAHHFAFNSMTTNTISHEPQYTQVNILQATQKKENNMLETTNPLEFSHLAKDGSLSMVAVEHKPQTLRKAFAYAFVRMTPKTIALLRQQALPKGDVLSVAKVAGIMGAKRTADSIPLCHPILLSYVDIRFNVNDDGVEILTEVRTSHNTGVEMEAIMAAQTAAATIYDMVKAVQKDMIIENVHLLYKEGGKSLFQSPDYSEDLVAKFA